MAELSADTKQLREKAAALDAKGSELDQIGDMLGDVSKHLSTNKTLSEEMHWDNIVGTERDKVAKQAAQLFAAAKLLGAVADIFDQYDKKVQKVGLNNGLDSFLDGNYQSNFVNELTQMQTDENGRTDYFEGEAHSALWINEDGEVVLDGEYGYFKTDASVTVGGGSSDGTRSTGAKAKGEIDAAISHGQFSANTGGWVSSEGEYNVAHVHGEAEGNIAVTKADGKRDFGDGLSASGEANAADGKASGTFGSKYFNINFDANGAVLGADGSAGLSANVRKDPGVSVQGHAYLAKGGVGTQVTILGTKIKVGAKAYAGGIGYKAEATYGGAKVKGSLGAAYLAGADVEVEVDANGTIHLIGEAAKDVDTYVAESNAKSRWGVD